MGMNALKCSQQYLHSVPCGAKHSLILRFNLFMQLRAA